MTECTQTSEDGLQRRLPVTGREKSGEYPAGWHTGNLRRCSVLWGRSRTIRVQSIQ